MLDDLGATKLNAAEQDRIREAADTLLFSDDPTDESARRSLDDIEELVRHLTESGRWTDERATRLLDDVAACGPLTPVL
jgi:hypothetical protein